ncbi:hypothetical protein T07_8851 [Trichinella nelsoni]|uniref:Uncharacterized protein n=1 Tax=Trichinella nelsoni TaxID=6336 RepID=A0A0V0RLQ7_9BILA|nr:hypothetical protein T07_8851 [Trichinella nelsoni]
MNHRSMIHDRKNSIDDHSAAFLDNKDFRRKLYEEITPVFKSDAITAHSIFERSQNNFVF